LPAPSALDSKSLIASTLALTNQMSIYGIWFSYSVVLNGLGKFGWLFGLDLSLPGWTILG
jgi:hypothetical protein